MKKGSIVFSHTKAKFDLVASIDCDKSHRVDVVSDEDGSCEWMICANGGDVESHSDRGYGQPGPAMRDGLISYFGHR